jgi:hypothetical protein
MIKIGVMILEKPVGRDVPTMNAVWLPSDWLGEVSLGFRLIYGKMAAHIWEIDNQRLQ